MTIKQPALLHYPKTIMRISPSLKHLKSRFLVADCLHRNAFVFRWQPSPHISFLRLTLPSSLKISRRVGRYVRSSVDDGRSDSSGSSTNGRTRLVRAIQALQIKLNARFKEVKKGFPMKLLFFLVGFYCATAFATVIGQTGDWDILSAGFAVVLVEGLEHSCIRLLFLCSTNLGALSPCLIIGKLVFLWVFSWMLSNMKWI